MKQKRITYLKKMFTKCLKAKTLRFLDFCNDSSGKDETVDIFIPVALKDVYKLKLVVESLRNNLLHKIGNIYVVSQVNEDVKKICQKLDLTLVDEDTVLPIKISDIDYFPRNQDRRGWIFQQLLKLSADNICTNEYILVVDSDTVLARPQSFLAEKKKMVFDCSDEYHQPYYKTYTKLLGLEHKLGLSFVAHHILFKKVYLREMKKYIEQYNQKLWWKAILENLDNNECSSFSEYETYGNYMYTRHREQVALREWYNCSTKYADFLKMTEKQKQKYKTISMHSYNEK